MKILFFAKYYTPHIGGVEKHIKEVSQKLQQNGYQISIITEKHTNELLDQEKLSGIKIYRFSYPKLKFLGLFVIWIKLFKYCQVLLASDIIHIHDVAIWYLPLRILLFWKPVVLTMHGWEGIYPIPLKNKILKKLSAAISNKTIFVGSYIEKYYGIVADYIIYGGATAPQKTHAKDQKLIIYLGRLGQDTGLKAFLSAAKKIKGYKVEFCGDGPLAPECQKVGKVHGFVNPQKYLARASICFASGYLSVLEALSNRCKVIVSYDNALRKDVFFNSPFKEFIFVCKDQTEILKAIKAKNKSTYKNILSWLGVAKVYQEVYNCVI